MIQISIMKHFQLPCVPYFKTHVKKSTFFKFPT